MEYDDIKGIIPPVVIRKGNYYEVTDEYSILTLILSYIIGNRRRKGVFGRDQETIEYAYLVYYPIYIQAITDTKAYIIDPYIGDTLKLSYKTPFIDLVYNQIRRLEGLKNNAFIEHLDKIISFLNEMVIKEKYFIKTRIELRNIVLNKAFLHDLNFLLSYSMDRWINGYTLGLNKDYMKQIIEFNKIQIKRLLGSSYKVINVVNQLIPLIDQYFLSWREDLRRHVEEIINEKRKQLMITKEEVDLRMHELRERLDREIENVENNYRPIIESLSRQMDLLSSRIVKSQEEYIGNKGKKIAKELKKHIKAMEKERNTLSKKLRNLMKKLEEEKKRISDEYRRLMELELRRVSVLEKEIDDLMVNRDRLVEKASTMINRVKNYLIQLSDYMNRLLANIYRNAINTPLKGPGIYLIPYIIVGYRSRKGVREYFIAPVYIDIYGYSRPRFFEYNSIYLYVRDAMEKIFGKQGIYRDEKFDLLRHLNRDIIVDRAKYLLDQGVIDKYMYNDILDFIKTLD